MSLICKAYGPVQGFLIVVVAVVIGLLGGCGAPPGTGAAKPGSVDAAAARESLLEQDRRFAEAVQTEGVARAYRQFMAEDAVQLQDGGSAIGGREAIYRELRAITEGADFVLTWEPLEAAVAASGELGYTWGIYYFEAEDELGAPYVAEGKYVYVWRRTDERWELILDITNQTEPEYTDEASDYDDYADWNEEAGLDAVPQPPAAEAPINNQ